MRRPGLLLLATLLFTAAAAASPVAHPTLTLSEAVAHALDRYPGLAAARAETRAAEAGGLEAEAARRPTVSLTGSAIQYQEPLPVTPIHGFSPADVPDFDDTLVQAGITAEHTLLDGGARRGRIELANAEAAAAGAGAEAVAGEVVAATARAYLAVLDGAARLDAHRQRLSALDAERQRVEQLLAVGRAAELDRRRVAAAVAAAEAERVQLATRLDSVERELARLTALPPEAARAAALVPLARRPEPPAERAALYGELVAASPAVAAARRRLAAAEAARTVAASGGKPRLGLTAGLQAFGDGDLAFDGEWNAGLRLALPLYTGGAVAARVARAEAAVDAAAESLRLTELEEERELDRALADLAETAARAKSLRAAEEQLAEVARIERLRLATGVGIQTDYLDAEAELVAVRAAEAGARYGEIAARVELARITGRLDAATLVEIVQPAPATRTEGGGEER